MLEITERAAAAIARACSAQEVASSGGLRIAPKTAVHDGSLKSLVVEFVDRPKSSDSVVHAGDVAVFLADGIAPLMGGRVLDAEHEDMPPRFVLRTRKPPNDAAPT
jgi:Fe-S cluster assembly iron-binding protein IscA